jgi:hypothetical protein
LLDDTAFHLFVERNSFQSQATSYHHTDLVLTIIFASSIQSDHNPKTDSMAEASADVVDLPVSEGKKREPKPKKEPRPPKEKKPQQAKKKVSRADNERDYEGAGVH